MLIVFIFLSFAAWIVGENKCHSFLCALCWCFGSRSARCETAASCTVPATIAATWGPVAPPSGHARRPEDCAPVARNVKYSQRRASDREFHGAPRRGCARVPRNQ